MTQEELAERAGVSVRSIGNLESGRVGVPRPPTVRLLAEAFGLGGADRDHFCQAVSADSADEPLRNATSPLRNAAPAQLPADVSRFAGRCSELARLDDLLADRSRHHSRAVTIVAVSGGPGVGKTTLAVHWAHRVREQFPDGQLYVNLCGFGACGEESVPAEVLRDLLEALGAAPERLPTTVAGQAGLYRSLMAGQRILLVLDNARDAEHVRLLLPGTPTALVVVTSRDQLMPLLAVSGAYPLTLDLMARGEARELLAERLGGDRVAAEPAAVDEIITACAGLPLAIAIAAARAQSTRFPLDAIAAQLGAASRRLDMLDAGDPASRVRAVFSWSYAALSASAARLFRLLGLHPGSGLSVAAAASIAGLPPALTHTLLSELTRVGLLTEQTPDRYGCHDLLRAYATELLQQTDSDHARRAARRRMLDHYTVTARAAARLIDPHRDPVSRDAVMAVPDVSPETFTDRHEAAGWLGTHRPVVLGLLPYTVETGCDDHVWQLAWAFTKFLYRAGSLQEVATLWQAAIPAAERLGDPGAQAYGHRYLALRCSRLHDYPAARRHLQRAMDLFGAAGDSRGEGACHLGLAGVSEREGQPAQALEHSRQALALFEAGGHRYREARALNAVGWYSALVGDHASAITHCERSLQLADHLGDRHLAANVWDSLGYAHHQSGNHTRAIECYHRALELQQDNLGDRYHKALTLAHLGDAQHSAGQVTEACVNRQHARDILAELGDRG